MVSGSDLKRNRVWLHEMKTGLVEGVLGNQSPLKACVEVAVSKGQDEGSTPSASTNLQRHPTSYGNQPGSKAGSRFMLLAHRSPLKREPGAAASALQFVYGAVSVKCAIYLRAKAR